MMIKLNKENCAKFDEKFWEFYIETGFGNKSKTDIDATIYDIICNLGIIDDTKSALLIGRYLRASETSIKKYKEERFFKRKIEDDKLKEQVRSIFRSNQIKLSKGSDKITFTVSNVAAKLYVEELLHNSGRNYDYTNNPSNISMNIETFVYIAQELGCDLNSGLNNIMGCNEIGSIMGEKNIIIQNIYNSNKSTSDKVIEILSIISQVSGGLLRALKYLGVAI